MNLKLAIEELVLNSLEQTVFIHTAWLGFLMSMFVDDLVMHESAKVTIYSLA